MVTHIINPIFYETEIDPKNSPELSNLIFKHNFHTNDPQNAKQSPKELLPRFPRCTMGNYPSNSWKLWHFTYTKIAQGLLQPLEMTRDRKQMQRVALCYSIVTHSFVCLFLALRSNSFLNWLIQTLELLVILFSVN